MAIQVSYSRRDVREELVRRRETYIAAQRSLSPPSPRGYGNMECVHCHNRFIGVTADAWKFGLCDDCLHHD
jgi:hypothetical protein